MEHQRKMAILQPSSCIIQAFFDLALILDITGIFVYKCSFMVVSRIVSGGIHIVLHSFS